jgi:hypothetical protein
MSGNPTKRSCILTGYDGLSGLWGFTHARTRAIRAPRRDPL